MTQLHPQAPTGSQLQVGAVFAVDRFIPGGAIKYFRRAKTASGFIAKRPRVRNENMDPSRQVIPGVNVAAELNAMKFDIQPDVDSLVPFRACHNRWYAVGPQVGTTAGAGTVATNGTTAIVGTGSAFTTALVGQFITITGEPKPLLIDAVADGTHLTLHTAAATTASGLAWSFASVPVFPWLFHPKTPTEAAPPQYVESMDYEISDGSSPVKDYECGFMDLEVKISDGKIQEITESWIGCMDTFLSDPTVVKTANTFTAGPQLFGHLSSANVAKIPLRLRITNPAGAGFDGKFKIAFTKTVSGTVTTAGSTALLGVGTHFDTELANGDELYISGEAPLFVSSVTDATHLVLTTNAATTASGLSYSAATFSGTAIPFTFGIAAELNTIGPNANGGRIGNSLFDSLFVTFAPGFGTVSAGDEWSFTKPRPLSAAVYSSRAVMHSAGVFVTIDGQPYGGVPGKPGFHTVTMKLMVPLKGNMSTGSKYSQGNQPNGRVSATISFDRDRLDENFLNFLIAAESISINVIMYGNPFGTTGFNEVWQFTFNTCEVADDVRDVTTENVLPEKIDVNATRGLTRTLSGTLATNGTMNIIGSGTAFTTQLTVGDEVDIPGEPTPRYVSGITDDTHLTLAYAATTSASGLSCTALSPIWSEQLFSTAAAL